MNEEYFKNKAKEIGEIFCENEPVVLLTLLMITLQQITEDQRVACEKNILKLFKSIKSGSPVQVMKIIAAVRTAEIRDQKQEVPDEQN